MSIVFREYETDNHIVTSEGQVPRKGERIWLAQRDPNGGTGPSVCYDVEDVCWWVSQHETQACVYLRERLV